MQERNMAVYISWQLKEHEVNYPIHDLELLVVGFTFKIWRHYLYSERFGVFSDHKMLKYIFIRITTLSCSITLGKQTLCHIL